MTLPTLPEPISSFIGVVNAHDEAAFLDAFRDDGIVDDWGRIFVGRDEIKAWSDQEFIGASGTLTVEAVVRHSSQVTVVGDWRSNHANGTSRFTFDIVGDKIARMTIREA